MYIYIYIYTYMYIRVYICYIAWLHDATTISNHVISLELMVEDATMRVRDSVIVPTGFSEIVTVWVCLRI